MSKADKVVSNASPLIYLAKTGKLVILKDLFQNIMIPDVVFKETCDAQDSPDAIVISNAVNEGWIRIADSKITKVNLLAKNSGIDVGEAASILLAKDQRALFLIDDKMGRSVAEILGIRCMGTVGILLIALSKHLIEIVELTNILNQMIDHGFRLDIKVYRRVIQVARTIAENEK
ncbi:MAG: DUF3368 domain-containing protein [Candidatus Thorarchaeota archaeon]